MKYARANNDDKIMSYYLTKNDAVAIMKMVADSCFYERVIRELDNGYVVTIDNTTQSFIIENKDGKYESYDVTGYHVLKLATGGVDIGTSYTGDEQLTDGWTVRLSYIPVNEND